MGTEEEKMTASVKDKGDKSFLPGFRFHPTDDELVGFYLRRKVEKKPIRLDLIKHIDIYNHDPWDLPKGGSVGEKEWYFFCRRGRKYKNSVRPNRVTGSGFWKATGIDKPIYSVGEPRECIGLKKSLVYYRGSAGKGTKTDWMMHEFRLPASKSTDLSNTNNTCQEAEVWTICRIFKREVSYKQHAPERPKTCSRQSLTDSRSITSSSGSINRDKCLHFGAFAAVEIENKSFSDHIDERNQLFAGQLGSTGQVPYMSSSLSNSNANGDEFFKQPNWDELMQVVEFASNPLPPHLCWQVEH